MGSVLAEKRLRTAVEQALRGAGMELKQVREGRWDFSFKNGSVQTGLALCTEEWLHLSAPAPKAVLERDGRLPETQWALLEANGLLSGGIRYGIAPDASVRLYADVPLRPETAAVQEAVARACKGFRAAHRVSSSRAETPDETADETVSPAELCRAAGWAPEVRASGECAVALETPRMRWQGLFSAEAPWRVWTSVPVAVRPDSVGGGALARLLLEASRLFCMVRPVWRGAGELEFEAFLGAHPSSDDVHWALSALSTGMGLCGGVVSAFSDEAIANAYLRCAVARR
mgnify:CR=1 FL=1